MINIYISKQIIQIAQVKFVFNHVFDVIGCKYKFVETKSAANLIYGSKSNESKKEIIFLSYNENLWITNNNDFDNFDYNFYDCIHNCHYLLNRIWEKYSVKDTHGVVTLLNQNKIKFVQKSYIAEFILILKKDILTAFNIDTIPLWPNNASFCLTLTHDVDEPYKYYKPSYYYDELLWKVRKRKNIFSIANSALKFSESFFNNFRKNENFGFEYWQQFESSYQGKSAFYVAVINPFHSYGHSCDVPYNYDDYKIKKQLNILLDKGWEIGLHASMNSYLKLERLEEEKYKLETILGGKKVKGIRHHYWRLGNDIDTTHKHHFDSGFEYDSSLGLNDSIGFRSGTMWPYKLLNDSLDKTKSFYQIPPTIMDGNIFYYEDTLENYYSKIKSHFNYIESMNGCVVLDWHLEQSNLNRLNGAGQVLAEFFKNELSSKNIFITSPIDLLNWWKERKELISRLK